MSARLAREAAGEARVRGLGGERESGDVEDEDEDTLDQTSNPLLERSSAWWTDQISGCPSMLEETVMVLLDAGFKPQDCAVLRDKLHKIVDTSIHNYVKRYRMEVPMSCVAWLVPGNVTCISTLVSHSQHFSHLTDPYGILGPDEIQIKSSHRNLIGLDGLETDYIVGDVLVRLTLIHL
jgi:RNA-dependent RNA polymerase